MPKKLNSDDSSLESDYSIEECDVEYSQQIPNYDEDELYEIEKITNIDIDGQGKIWFEIKWKNYSEKDNTQEPISNLYQLGPLLVKNLRQFKAQILQIQKDNPDHKKNVLQAQLRLIKRAIIAVKYEAMATSQQIDSSFSQAQQESDAQDESFSLYY